MNTCICYVGYKVTVAQFQSQIRLYFTKHKYETKSLYSHQICFYIHILIKNMMYFKIKGDVEFKEIDIMQ